MGGHRGSPLAAEHSLGGLEFPLGFLDSNTWGAAGGASGKDEGEPAIMDVDPDAWFRDTISPRRAFLSSTCASTVRCRHLARPQRLHRKSRPRNHERTSWRAPSADPADADPGSAEGALQLVRSWFRGLDFLCSLCGRAKCRQRTVLAQVDDRNARRGLIVSLNQASGSTSIMAGSPSSFPEAPPAAPHVFESRKPR